MDPPLICPRPRNPRACDKCRTRKVRCLVAEEGADRGSCRRCIKFGYPCSYAAVAAQRQAEKAVTCRGKQSSISIANIDHDESNADIISGLCESKPPPPGGLNELVVFHQRAFKGHLHEENLPDSGYASLSTPGSLRHSDLTEPSPDDAPEPPNINLQEADTLLALFHQRKDYFPYVTVPSSTTAASMAASQPFLLLAILTVCSSRSPRLQQRTDERFRRVLSERIILHGEKRLDYARGLLVYIAWCPLHLRPLGNQVVQFMQIAISMVSDLGIDRNRDGRTREERDAYMGCCVLSSFITGFWPRSGEARLAMGLPQPVLSEHDSLQDSEVCLLELQGLMTRVAGYTLVVQTPGTNSLNGCVLKEPSKLQYTITKQMNIFNSELEDLVYVIPLDIRKKVPILLSTQLIRLAIAYISLKHILQSKSDSSASPTAHPEFDISQILEYAKSISTEIKEFFTLFLSAPATEYIYYSIREWSELIFAISMSSSLLFSPLPVSNATESPPMDTHTNTDPDLIANTKAEQQQIEWRIFQTATRAQILIYLEALAYRFSTLSVSGSSSPSLPDAFCMLNSVLQILVRRYEAPADPDYVPKLKCAADSTSTSISPTGFGVEVEAQGAALGPSSSSSSSSSSRSAPSLGPASSRCPVLNGSIQQTDYWRALKSHSPSDIDTGAATAAETVFTETLGNGMDGLSVDDLVRHPQDWPSVFEEWVVDLDYLPG